ncbi:MCE family protein [Actinomadura parmotrematis]|uniref:MCE family protein n=1 Tax=Actinomadura parmotrematis TaxID=2864039 RepID=A0ABS7G0W0_9ACTN|nr:MCE family protein [Actinomadura parmotrematis]MBW8486352.1 MCE family protein [Actinomadura parmotrematis]
MRPILLAGALALCAVLCGGLCGCSPQTLHAPTGPLTLTADFADVQNLVAGHSVKVADVTVGSVRRIDLVDTPAGYRSRVTMSIVEKVRVPTGTTAKVTVTSLLGENYVQLQPPPGRALNQGPFLADHAAIASTTTSPGFEDIIGQAAPLIGALADGDAPGLVHTAGTALGGRGPELNKMIANAGTLLRTFGEHRAELARAVDDLATLGRQLAAHEKSLDRLPGRLADATRLLADDRTRILDAVHALSDLAKTVNDTVLARHTDQLRRLIEQTGPTFEVLAADRTRLGTLITRLQEFVSRMPRQVYNGQLLTYPVLDFNGSATRAAGKSPASLADLVRMLGPRK